MKMSKVILICGKMCSGKTTYAKSLIKKNPAVLLSLDEITTLFFGSNGGAEHYVILDKAQKYLFDKSLEIIESGIDVIIDWGFWKKADRQEAILFYEKNNIIFEWHYVDVLNDDVLVKNLDKRNREIETGQQTSAFYFPEEIARRFWEEDFEIPEKNEMDIWYVNQPRL
jgi:predicted kinase